MSVVAVIDIGTVTTRLAVAELSGGRVVRLEKRTTITDLGQGVAASGRLAPEAIERVVSTAALYLQMAAGVEHFATTLTSAARDASNAAELTDRLEALGLAPQVIPGEVEGALTFLGVAQDAPGERILVADSGGGSTELALGSLVDGQLRMDDVRSLDVGCRRVTELFLERTDPPSAADQAEARAWCHETFAPHLAEIEGFGLPERLFAVGGTVTTLVAISEGIVPYDSSRVHLHALRRSVVDETAERLLGMPLAERAQTPGLQAKRAPVIGAGALVISELMRAADKDVLTVSEHDLLYGLAQAADAAVEGAPSPVGWLPVLSRREG